MIARPSARRPAAVALAALLALAAAPVHAATTLALHYVSIAEDPQYEPPEAYTGLELRARFRPREGAQTALNESRILGRAAGLAFELDEIEAADSKDAAARIAAAVAAGEGFFLLDLPAEGVAAAAEAVGDRAYVVLFNLRAPEDGLRAICSAALLHVAPSRSMLADALAQFLYAKTWRDVLMLIGPSDEDAAVAAAFRASAAKFGLRIVAETPFALGADPRRRDQTNVLLMTGRPPHDVVFVADASGEFGRFVPYATALPRPVLGTAGLTAEAWHWAWERHGAPQLNQRFDRVAGRRMTPDDWAGWAAVKSVVEAAVRLETVAAAEIAPFLRDPAFTLDLYKGAPGGYRAWDGQLRQPVLLATHDAVIERAPLDGFLHQTNTLDTLGADEALSPCR